MTASFFASYHFCLFFPFFLTLSRQPRSFYEKLLTTALFVILFTINIIQIVFLVEEIWLDEYY